jgi:hypothetical protein
MHRRLPPMPSEVPMHCCHSEAALKLHLFLSCTETTNRV